MSGVEGGAGASAAVCASAAARVVINATSLPPADPSRVPLAVGVIVVWAVYTLSTLAAWLHMRPKFSRLWKRSTLLLLVSSLGGGLCWILSVPVRDLVGETNFPCDLYYVLNLVVQPLLAVPIGLKLLLHVQRFEFVRARAAHVQRNPAASLVASSSTSPPSSSGDVVPTDGSGRAGRAHLQASSTNTCVEAAVYLRWLLRFSSQPPPMSTATSSRHSKSSRVPSKTLSDASASPSPSSMVAASPPPLSLSTAVSPTSPGSPGSPTSIDLGVHSSPARTNPVLARVSKEDKASVVSRRNLTFDTLNAGAGSLMTAEFRALRFQQTWSYVGLLLVVYSIPVVVFGAVVAAQLGVWGHGCMGCAATIEEIAGGLVLLVVFMGLPLAWFSWKFRNEKDPLGIIPETMLAVVLVGPLAAIVLLLSMTDPGGIQVVERRFLWATVGVVPLMLLHFIQCPLQIILARRGRDRALLARANYRLEDVLEHAELRKRFEDHLIAELNDEVIRFCSDVTDWKATYATRPDQQRRAREIFDLYIPDGALMQVNLPAQVREGLELVFGPGNVERDVFDEALANQVHLLETDCLPRFLATQDVKKRASNARRKAEGRRKSLFGM